MATLEMPGEAPISSIDMAQSRTHSSTLHWLATVLGEKEILILRQREKLGSSHLGDNVVGEDEPDAVDMFIDYLKKDGLTDEDLADFRASRDPEKMNEMSEEERKNCVESAKRVEALMTTWDGLRREALREFEKNLKEGIVPELDGVVESVDRYFLDNSIVIEVVKTVSEWENEFRCLKEENARLHKERDEIKEEWTKELDIQIEKHKAGSSDKLEVAMKKELDGLRLQLEGLEIENSYMREELRKKFEETSSLVEDYWLRIFEKEKLLALKRNDMVESGQMVSSIKRDLETITEQSLQLHHTVLKKKNEVLMLEKEWDEKVKVIRKLLERATELWNLQASC